MKNWILIFVFFLSHLSLQAAKTVYTHSGNNSSTVDNRIKSESNLTIDSISDIETGIDPILLQDVKVYGKTKAKQLEEGAFSVNAVEITPNINKMVQYAILSTVSPWRQKEPVLPSTMCRSTL